MSSVSNNNNTSSSNIIGDRAVTQLSEDCSALQYLARRGSEADKNSHSSGSEEDGDWVKVDEAMANAERELADDAEWKRIQQNTFTRWANEHLRQANRSISDLETDLSDGLKLIALIEVLSGKKMPRHNKKPTFRSQKLENVSIALQFLELEGITLVNIDSTDIVDCKLKLIMGLIWTLIIHYAISMPVWDGPPLGGAASQKTPKQRLMDWVKDKCPDLPIQNFTDNWRDGKAVGALVDSVAPGLCPDWASWDPKRPVENAREAMDLADDWLNVPKLLTPEEIVNPNVDEQSMMTYLSQFPNAKLKPGAPLRQKINANKVRAYGPGLEPTGLVAKAPAKFVIETFGAGDGDAAFRVIGPDGAEIPGEIVFNNDRKRTYSCSYFPEEEGDYKVIVTFATIEIPKSPYQVKVEGFAGDASKVTAYGPGLEPEGVVINKPTYFDINATGAGKGKPEVIILDPHGKKDSVPLELSLIPGETEIYRCNYVSSTLGLHSVNVFFAGNPIPKSPFGVNVSPASLPHKVWASGRGLQPQGIRNNETVEFRVHTEGAGEGKVTVKIIGPGGTNVETTSKKIDEFTTEYVYTPIREGRHVIMINFANQEIPKSPFEVNVGPIKTSNIRAYGPGLKGGIAKQPARFTVETNGETGSLGFSIEGPSEAKISVDDNGDGSANVSYLPTAPGEYAVHIYCDNEDIPKSPYMAQIIPATDYSPGKVKCYGPGLENGVKPNEETHFTIDINGAGQAPLEVMIHDGLGEYEPKVKQVSEEIFTCYYTPRKGQHLQTIMVNFGGVAVEGSPFRVLTDHPVDPSLVKVYGPGVESNSVRAEIPVEFTVDSSEAGPGELDVEIFTSKRRPIPVETRSVGNGLTIVKYKTMESGPHVVNVKFDSEHVPKSPITVDVKQGIDVNKIKLKDFETRAFVDCPNDFVVDACALPPTKRSVLTCLVKGPKKDSPPVETFVQKVSPEGLYEVVFTPREEGDHIVDLKYDGVPLPDSPFKVEAIRGCDPSKVKAYGSGLERGIVDKSNVFTVKMNNAGSGGLRLAMEGPSEAKMSCDDNHDGTCTVSYVPYEEGDYDVTVKFGDDHIPGSPFSVPVTTLDGKPKPNAKKVTAYGPGLESNKILPGKPAKFTVDASKTGEAKVEVNLSSIDDKLKHRSPSVIDKGDGIHEVTYIPPPVGDPYKISVNYGGDEIPQSPFELTCSPTMEDVVGLIDNEKRRGSMHGRGLQRRPDGSIVGDDERIQPLLAGNHFANPQSDDSSSPNYHPIRGGIQRGFSKDDFGPSVNPTGDGHGEGDLSPFSKDGPSRRGTDAQPLSEEELRKIDTPRKESKSGPPSGYNQRLDGDKWVKLDGDGSRKSSLISNNGGLSSRKGSQVGSGPDSEGRKDSRGSPSDKYGQRKGSSTLGEGGPDNRKLSGEIGDSGGRDPNDYGSRRGSKASPTSKYSDDYGKGTSGSRKSSGDIKRGNYGDESHDNDKHGTPSRRGSKLDDSDARKDNSSSRRGSKLSNDSSQSSPEETAARRGSKYGGGKSPNDSGSRKSSYGDEPSPLDGVSRKGSSSSTKTPSDSRKGSFGDGKSDSLRRGSKADKNASDDSRRGSKLSGSRPSDDSRRGSKFDDDAKRGNKFEGTSPDDSRRGSKFEDGRSPDDSRRGSKYGDGSSPNDLKNGRKSSDDSRRGSKFGDDQSPNGLKKGSNIGDSYPSDSRRGSKFGDDGHSPDYSRRDSKFGDGISPDGSRRGSKFDDGRTPDDSRRGSKLGDDGQSPDGSRRGSKFDDGRSPENSRRENKIGDEGWSPDDSRRGSKFGDSRSPDDSRRGSKFGDDGRSTDDSRRSSKLVNDGRSPDDSRRGSKFGDDGRSPDDSRRDSKFSGDGRTPDDSRRGSKFGDDGRSPDDSRRGSKIGDGHSPDDSRSGSKLGDGRSPDDSRRGSKLGDGRSPDDSRRGSKFGVDGSSPDDARRGSKFGDNGRSPDDARRGSKFGDHGRSPDDARRGSKFGDDGRSPDDSRRGSKFGDDGHSPDDSQRGSKLGDGRSPDDSRRGSKFGDVRSPDDSRRGSKLGDGQSPDDSRGGNKFVDDGRSPDDSRRGSKFGDDSRRGSKFSRDSSKGGFKYGQENETEDYLNSPNKYGHSPGQIGSLHDNSGDVDYPDSSRRGSNDDHRGDRFDRETNSAPSGGKTGYSPFDDSRRGSNLEGDSILPDDGSQRWTKLGTGLTREMSPSHGQGTPLDGDDSRRGSKFGDGSPHKYDIFGRKSSDDKDRRSSKSPENKDNKDRRYSNNLYDDARGGTRFIDVSKSRDSIGDISYGKICNSGEEPGDVEYFRKMSQTTTSEIRKGSLSIDRKTSNRQYDDSATRYGLDDSKRNFASPQSGDRNNNNRNGGSRRGSEFYPLELSNIPVPPRDSNVTAEIKKPSGQRDFPVIQNNDRGSVDVYYQPNEEGLHILEIKSRGEHVQGSPYKFQSCSTEDGKVRAFGEGLTHGVCGDSAKFVISTKGANAGGLELAVEGPSKAEINCFNNKDGTVDVSFCPTAPGEYSITTKFADEHIEGSPFTCKVTGEGKKRNQISVGSSSELSLPENLSEYDLRSLTAFIVSPSGIEEPCFLKKLPRGNNGISFTPREVGEHLVSVKRNGKHISDSPFKIQVRQNDVGDASRVKASGVSLQEGKTHTENVFTVDTKNAGYGGLSLSVEGPSKAEINCKDNEDGTLDVSYKPTEPGFYTVNMKFADQHIPGSPFMVSVDGDGLRKKEKNIQRMREAVPANEVGSQCTMTFKMPGIDHKSLKAEVSSPSSRETSATLTEIEEGLYAVNFVPHELGIHTVNIIYKEANIPGSPFQFTVGPLQDGGSHLVRAGGPGLARGIQGQPADFNVWTREAGHGSLAISVEGPSKAEVDFKDRKDGSCHVSYVVEEPGEYSVGIRFNDTHIPESPFKVCILPSGDEAERVRLSNVADVPVLQDAPQTMLLNMNGADGDVECKLVSPSGREDDCFITPLGEGEHSVRFVPKEEGLHYLHARLNGIHIPGSPYKVIVGNTRSNSASTVSVTGSGIRAGHTGEKSSFIINTSGVGAGTLSVTVDGPSKVDLACTEVETGYEISYVPLVPGKYYITICYNGKNVNNSPFSVEIDGDHLGSGPVRKNSRSSMTMETMQRTSYIRHQYSEQRQSISQSSNFLKSSPSSTPSRRIEIERAAASSDGSKVVCAGSGLERASTRRRNSFNVDCSKAGNNILFVGIYGPETPCEEVNIKHRGDKKYSVDYTIQDNAEYIIYVKYGDEHVPGSPFHVETNQ